MAGACVGAEDEVALAIGHVVERDGSERLEEDKASFRVQLVLDAAVDNCHVAWPELLVSSPIVIVTSPSTMTITCSVCS